MFQVSHHPPIAAQHCEGKNWNSWQEFTMSSKFRGKYLQLTPSGIAHLQFRDSGTELNFCFEKTSQTFGPIFAHKFFLPPFYIVFPCTEVR